MHEFVVSLADLKNSTGVTAKDFSKRLLDYGVHAPTIYFPLIVEEALMIEPTESNALKELDNYCRVFEKVIEESFSEPNLVKESPYNTSVGRIDEVKASKPKTMIPTYKWMRERLK
jgi:glycine dehydrogenase subunit 2